MQTRFIAQPGGISHRCTTIPWDQLHLLHCHATALIARRLHIYKTRPAQLRTHLCSASCKLLPLCFYPCMCFSLVALPNMPRSVHRDMNYMILRHYPGMMLLLALLVALTGGRGTMSQADPCAAGEQSAHSSCGNGINVKSIHMCLIDWQVTLIVMHAGKPAPMHVRAATLQ
jgi:hypothetical protein